MKYPTLKAVICGFLPLLIMISELAVTGVIEYTMQCDDMTAWIAEIILCIATIILILFLEHKLIPKDYQLAFNLIFFISSLISGFIALGAVNIYLDNFFRDLNPWDDGFLPGLQWAIYLFTVYGQFVLHLIVRLIIGGVRKLKKSNKNNA